jgi:hypothetical protein
VVEVLGKYIMLGVSGSWGVTLAKDVFDRVAKNEDKGQTQCQRLPHEWGLGKGITEANDRRYESDEC